MVKSYLEYIKEHFGAITIERPPEDMFVKNPNLPQPLSINTWVGGTGRIPMHWNNSPYLSGGFGGSGYGRFGSDPDGNDSSDLILDYLNAMVKIEELLSKVDTNEYVKIALELKKDLESGNILLDDMGPLDEELDRIEIPVEIETIDYPTSGTNPTHDDPGDPGDAGEYQTLVILNDQLARLLEVDLGEKSKVIDLEEIANIYLLNSGFITMALTQAGIPEASSWLEDCAENLEKNIQDIYEKMDDHYINDEDSPNVDTLRDISEDVLYSSLKYLIKFSNINLRKDNLDTISNVRKIALEIKNNNLKPVIERPIYKSLYQIKMPPEIKWYQLKNKLNRYGELH